MMEGIKKFSMSIGEITAEENEVFSYGFHTHDHYEMTLYEPFEGNICINGKNIDTSRGVATLIAPLDFHETTVKEKCGAKFIKIGFASNVAQENQEHFSSIIKNTGDLCFEISLFKEIAGNIKSCEYAERLIECALSIFSFKGERILSADHSSGQLISKAAIEYINNHFTEDISLDSVAKQLAVSPNYLSQIFKASLNINYSKYLIDIRLRHAEKLMRLSDKTLTEICFLSGFGNFSHFSRSFKEKYAATPREYRKIARK